MILSCQNVSKAFGTEEILKKVSFHVEENEKAAIVGINGAGKSTTLNTVSGLLKPRDGSVFFDGSSIVGVPAHKIVGKGMALCPEGRRIFAQLSVEENLEMGAFTRPGSEIKDSMERVYENFPRLKERYKQTAGTLSGGEQQMLAMGRALMSKPDLMMLDEPSMGLAPILVDQIFEIIKKLHKNGTTILLVEQNAKMALSIADKAYVLETGRIKMSGDAKELMSNDDVRKAYLGV